MPKANLPLKASNNERARGLANPHTHLIVNVGLMTPPPVRCGCRPYFCDRIRMMQYSPFPEPSIRWAMKPKQAKATYLGR